MRQRIPWAHPRDRSAPIRLQKAQPHKRMQIKHTFVLILALFAALPTKLAFGGEDMEANRSSETNFSIPHKRAPCQWDYWSSTCTGPGIFMDEIITIEVGGTQFKIPAIYFTTWLKP